MQTKELRFGISYTHNLGNYQSLRLEASETIELEEGDNRDEQLSALADRVRFDIYNQLNAALERIAGNTDPTFIRG